MSIEKKTNTLCLKNVKYLSFMFMFGGKTGKILRYLTELQSKGDS